MWRSNNEDRVALSLLGQGAEVLSLGIPLPGLGLLGRLCGCFEEGTLVATPDGPRRIEEVEIGDSVLAWNPETGETTTEIVTALIRPEPKLLWRLEARDADGETERFFVTDDHPWFVEGVGWMETRHLAAGQRIETADDRGLTILDIAPTDRIARTYTLTVTGPHTFLVGEDGAVVHNCQWHHWTSRRIHAALQRHQVLRGAYRARDSRFVSRGRTADSHRGYQGWHRSVDAEVTEWLAANPNATPAEFEAFMHQIYSRPEMVGRFGGP